MNLIVILYHLINSQGRETLGGFVKRTEVLTCVDTFTNQFLWNLDNEHYYNLQVDASLHDQFKRSQLK